MKKRLHPLAQKIEHIKTAISKLEKKKDLLDEELTKTFTENLIKKVWGFRVLVHNNAEGYDSNLPAGFESITIYPYVKNENDLRAYFSYFNVNYVEEPEINSVIYFLINDEICQYHGGYIVLKCHVVRTKEEWEEIKTGNIADKFLNDYYLK